MASTTNLLYKSTNEGSLEFFIVVNTEAFREWKKDEDRSSIPLTNVMETFQVFHFQQGSHKVPMTPSKQQLETAFGTDKQDEIIQHILDHHLKEQPNDITKGGLTTLNAARGAAVNIRGSQHTTGVKH